MNPPVTLVQLVVKSLALARLVPYVSDDDFDVMNVVLFCFRKINCGKAFLQHCVTDYHGNFLQFITVIFTRKFLAIVYKRKK